MAKRVIVVHDVLGTLFGFQGVIDELQSIFGDQVKDRMFAELIVMDWYHAAQRDFCFLSINGQYQPIANVFKASLPRVLLQAGLRSPADKDHDVRRAVADAPADGVGGAFDPEITQRMMNSLQSLQPRPGMVDAFTKTYRDVDRLHAAHVDRVDLWGATNGGLALARKLFEGAFNGSQSAPPPPVFTGAGATAQQSATPSPGHGVAIFSCDESKVAKPDPRVYHEIKRRIMQSSDDHNNTSIWFVASHTWDLFAAKQAGFKTAWATYEEFDMCKDIFGTHDVVASDLVSIAMQILEHEKS